MAACQPPVAQTAQDSRATALPADSSLPAVTAGTAKDTALPTAFGLPDTLTIGAQLYRVVPSTQELFESAPEFMPDTSEARNIARQADRVRREGDALILQLGNGTEKRLEHKPMKDGEDYEEYIYQGYQPALKSFVVWKNGYEYFDVQLVNEQTGEQVTAIGLPQVSPDGKHAVASNLDLMAAFTTNGLEYFTVSPAGVALAYEYQPEKWGPYCIKWLDGKVLVAKLGVMTKDMDVVDQYVRLEPVGK